MHVNHDLLNVIYNILNVNPIVLFRGISFARTQIALTP